MIVNDFGALDIDAEILRRSDGLTLTLANGCVCCSAASGLYDAFEATLNASPRPERIIIEASGVADPARLNAIANAEPSLEARAVITVADCLAIGRDIEDPLKQPDILRQLRAGDLILLSKADLVTADVVEQVRAMISGIVPATFVEPLARSSLPDALTLAFNTATNSPLLTVAASHDPEVRYETCSFRCGRLDDLKSFVRDIGELPATVVRLKGIVIVTGQTEPFILNLAGQRLSVTSLSVSACKDTLVTAIFEKGSGARYSIQAILRRHFREVRCTGGERARP